jgi:hypothetical protein
MKKFLFSIDYSCGPNRIINEFFNIGIDKRLFGLDSVISIAIRCGLDGPVIQSRSGRDFTQPPRPALGPPIQ